LKNFNQSEPSSWAELSTRVNKAISLGKLTSEEDFKSEINQEEIAITRLNDLNPSCDYLFSAISARVEEKPLFET
jgi:hypothetical protein